MRDYLDESEILCQLAEEVSELAQAALKLRRARGGGRNYTPVTEKDARKQLFDEIADVLVCLSVIGIDTESKEISETRKWKRERWMRRLDCAARKGYR